MSFRSALDYINVPNVDDVNRKKMAESFRSDTTRMQKYTRMQKEQYDREATLMAVENHAEHNKNPDYWNVLLGPIKTNPEKWKGLHCLDFGCGCGRNLVNLHALASWGSVDGCDISEENIKQARNFLEGSHDLSKSMLYVTTGIDLQPIPSDRYDFVMSTIVLQHICVYDIRRSILADIFRVLRPGGLFSFQMKYGTEQRRTGQNRHYFDNFYDAEKTNGDCDVIIENENDLIRDLQNIGFQNITFQICNSWADGDSQWIYVKAFK